MKRRSAAKYLVQVYGRIKTEAYREALAEAIYSLRGPTREQVEKLRGEWLHDTDTGYEVCDRCSHTISLDDYLNRNPPPFCENCGSPMTDKAVDILLRRLEELHEDLHNT